MSTWQFLAIWTAIIWAGIHPGGSVLFSMTIWLTSIGLMIAGVLL